MDYHIHPVQVPGFADATGVHVNRFGAWLGKVDVVLSESQGEAVPTECVQLYSDKDGNFVPAPENWRSLIVRQL